MRKTSLFVSVAVAVGIGTAVASASIAADAGDRSAAPRTVAYYIQKDATDAEIPIIVGEDPPHWTVLELALPDVGGRQAFLGTATFTLVNFGPVDAQVNCGVGNRMGHELFVPVNQLSNPSLGGLWGQNIATFTLTGMVHGGGTMVLGCHLVDWVGSSQGTPAPEVGFRRGSLEAWWVPRLQDQTSSA